MHNSNAKMAKTMNMPYKSIGMTNSPNHEVTNVEPMHKIYLIEIEIKFIEMKIKFCIIHFVTYNFNIVHTHRHKDNVKW